MRKLILIFALAPALMAQTVTFNDSTVLRTNPRPASIQMGTLNYYDSGQMLKNLIGSLNPGFEPLINQAIYVLTTAGTANSFTEPVSYDTPAVNYWAGATFNVIASQSGGAELGCSTTIASNTSGPPPVFTLSSSCAAALAVGDMITLSMTTSPTPESWLESSNGGFWSSISGGGKITADTTDLCATCGTQALHLNATSGTSKAILYYDTQADDVYVLMNGTYSLSFWAKAASGSPTMTVTAARPVTGGFSCGPYTPTLTATWTQYTYSCTASENASVVVPGNANVTFSVTGGAAYLDNPDFEKTGATNTTILTDAAINAFKTALGTGAQSPGLFRFWLGQNGETAYNWTQPDYARLATAAGPSYEMVPNGGGSRNLSLEDYLVICQYLGAEPYLEIPVTITTADASNIIDFLGGSTGTTYGARRAALGQTAPWTSVFSKIHLSYCNECWNSTGAGQNLPWRSSAPSTVYYYDYQARATPILAAMRATGSYTSAAFDLTIGLQTAVNYSADASIAAIKPDSIELNDYQVEYVPTTTPTDAQLWGPAMVNPYFPLVSSTDVSNLYTSIHDYQALNTCGASGTAACQVSIYEWGQNTLSISGSTIDQTHLDYANAGGGNAVIDALVPLSLIQTYGIDKTNMFSLAQYQFQSGSLQAKLWGEVVDMGGATNNVRPGYLGLELANAANIGNMYSCPISSGPTYTFAGSTSTPNPPSAMPSLSGVPYLYAFCFENGTARAQVYINTDLTSSHTLTFAGTNPPTGTVTVKQVAPPSLDSLNEAATGTPTNTTAATVSIATSSLTSPSSVSLPPYSVTEITYSTSAPAPPVLTGYAVGHSW